MKDITLSMFRLLNHFDTHIPYTNYVVSPLLLNQQYNILRLLSQGETKQNIIRKLFNYDPMRTKLIKKSLSKLDRIKKYGRISNQTSLWVPYNCDIPREVLQYLMLANIKYNYIVNRQSINFWSEEQSGGVIKKVCSAPRNNAILTSISIFDYSFNLLFRNPYFFKSGFQYNKQTYEVDYISKIGKFNISETEHYQILRLVLKDGSFFLKIFLPKTEMLVSNIPYKVKFLKKEVRINLPIIDSISKIKLSDLITFDGIEISDFDLKDSIIKTSLNLFYGKTTKKQKIIDRIEQRLIPISFNACKPFYYSIEDKRGNICYFGKYSHPSLLKSRSTACYYAK